MKTKIQLLLGMLLAMLIIMSACKKDTLQPSFNPFVSQFEVFTDLNSEHGNIKQNIKNGRHIIDGEYNWDDEIILVGGPVGYWPLHHKGAENFCQGFQEELMPDTTQLCTGCMQERIIKAFLEEKWGHDAETAFKRLRLDVPKEVYEVCPWLFEWFLLKESEYLQTQIGGNPDWYAGTRDVEKEKEIAMLPYTAPANYEDPWECGCKPFIYVEDWYKNYSEGDDGDKSMITDKDIYISNIQNFSAEKRSESMGGFLPVEEYITTYDANKEVYCLNLLVVVDQ